MQSSPSANALIKSSVDRHQIGKTGSFWLPPKASYKTQLGQKSQVLSENKNNPQDFKNSFPTNTSQKSNSLMQSGSSNASPANTKKDLILNKPELSSRVISVKSPNTSNIKSNKINTQITSFVGSSPQKVFRSSAGVVNDFAGHINNSTKLKSLNRGKSDMSKIRLDQDLDSSHDESFSDGTRYAFSLLMDLNSFQLSSDFEKSDTEFPNFDSKSSTLGKLKNFFGDTLLPRISHFCKNGKEVVRFSVDLPDGNPLGIRLQKKNQSFSICLISPQNRSSEFLMNMTSGLKSVFSSNKHSLKVFHFNSFSQMDAHFSS
jgi:hypothetical protein